LLTVGLSMTAGAVDVIGFLALGGLFSSAISGNLVVLAAHFVTGAFSAIGPLLAVPVFVAVLGAVTLASASLKKAGYSSRRASLVLHAALLAACLALGAGLGPFANADSAMAVLVGMLAVAARATQNALVKLELPDGPSTAVMTTNIVQLAIDLVMLLRRRTEPDDRARARHRAGATFPAVVGFLLGCAAGAVLEVWFGLRALVLPATLALITVRVGWVEK
jgi:uncharacterized membrane protein YoaK (UPF0700 family)